MKHLIRLWICLLLVGFSIDASGQEPERGSVLPGYIVTLQGDTVKGYLLNINLWLNQNMTFYYDHPENAEGRIKYKPNDLLAYQVGSGNYESIKFPFTYSTHKQSFILRKIEGAVNYYVWYYDKDRSKLKATEITLDGLSSSFDFDEKALWTETYVRKGNEKFTKISGLKYVLNFAKNMSEYLKDDPELSKKIQGKTVGYQSIDTEKIIKEYNSKK